MRVRNTHSIIGSEATSRRDQQRDQHIATLQRELRTAKWAGRGSKTIGGLAIAFAVLDHSATTTEFFSSLGVAGASLVVTIPTHYFVEQTKITLAKAVRRREKGQAVTPA